MHMREENQAKQCLEYKYIYRLVEDKTYFYNL